MPETAARQRRREELSRFLRSRRSRLTPDEFGIAVSGRRRTPGLRREEVAVLAGVGTSWYTWLEQGREINVSESVVSAISRVLRLSPSERSYLFRLTGLKPPAHPDPEDARRDTAFLERLAETVDRWSPNPALVKDRFWNVLAANEPAARLLGFTPDSGNILLAFFTDDHRHERYADAGELARDTVARFRAEVADWFGHPRLEALVAELCDRSPDFSALWHGHDVSETTGHRTKEIRHPDAGPLALSVLTWDLSAHEGVQLILHTPADPATQTRLAALFPRA
ncbi:helix-turn-helix transcriptional regulator [Streptomyces specialis]|uniref:helix-turn-helix transcriptional regulator n=1 Tax=Streptomyces specialis TaxID=498367 RepID=UPI00073F5EA6|nr:helix-turn-helix transcriptional regulator [Streptomyces specialis]